MCEISIRNIGNLAFHGSAVELPCPVALRLVINFINRKQHKKKPWIWALIIYKSFVFIATE